MTVHLSFPFFRSVLWTVCLVIFLSASAVFAADYVGPVFPDDSLADPEVGEPLPLPMPKRSHHLLQRPDSRQVQVNFDDLDPTGSLIPQDLLDDEEIDSQLQLMRQKKVQARTTQHRTPKIDTENILFTNEGGVLPCGMIEEYSCCGETCSTGPLPVPFGMGLFDNVSFFSESTAFKTGLNGGEGSFGLGEGINWAAALTPQGAFAGQYGVRAVQGDLFERHARSQLFMTAGVFKRFDSSHVQTGAAVDWLQETSQYYGTVNLRQLRCELSTRVFNSVEFGFGGTFDVFSDRPTFGVRDYYTLFFRKHLNCGGQAELRCGSTDRGEFIMNALAEVAVTDRVALNGGIAMLAPNGTGNSQESWSMSMGVVIYFRGGAACRQINSYRPMFDVAGNNSFFTR
ncbi:MAG: hypothetical protein LBI05_08050 [Planctomycetaceae bacterium]|jgi:hypothetical protein|nr:hypothetical protein [Planctomycetaceae bacterium]